MRREPIRNRIEKEKRKRTGRKLFLKLLLYCATLGFAAVLIFQTVAFLGVRFAPVISDFTMNYLGVRELAITGATDLTEKEIKEYVEPILKLNPNLVTLPTGPIKLFLSTRPYISKAEIRKELPGRLVITVEEKRTIAVLSRNGFFLLDNNGETIRQMNTGENIDVPVITIEDPLGEDALQEALKTACMIIQQDALAVPPLMPSELRIQKGMIVFKSIELKNSNNTIPPIYFGMEGVDKKVQYVKKIWPELVRKKDEIEYIDIRYKQGVSVKLKSTEGKKHG